MADETADVAVEELEAVRQDVTDVGQAEQHERDTHDGVQNGDHLSLGRLGRDIAVPCAQENRLPCKGQLRAT